MGVGNRCPLYVGLCCAGGGGCGTGVGVGRKAAWKGWLFREMEVLARRLEGKSIAALGGRRGAFGPLPRENRSSSLDI